MANQEVAKILSEMIKELDDKASALSKNVFQLVNMYTVFQGVIIAAVSQLSSSSSSSSKCYQWKYFLTFSIVMLGIYGLPLAYMTGFWVEVLTKRDRYNEAREKANAGLTEQAERLKNDKFREWIYRTAATVTILLLLAFNGFVGYASHAMLCGHKRVSDNANCLQVGDKICTAGN